MLVLVLPLLGSCGGGGGDGSGNGPVSTDRLAPTVLLTAPASFASGSAPQVALVASATDNVAVTRVEFEVDGEPVGADTLAPYTAN